MCIRDSPSTPQDFLGVTEWRRHQQKKENIHIGENTTEKDFVNLREARDTTLLAPQLMIPSIQVNMRAGNLPKEEDNGTTYLKVPIKMSD